MTRDEQFKAIIEKIGPVAASFQPIHLSVLIMTEYMDALFNVGVLFEKPIAIEESGKKALEICKEMGWYPSDSDIVAFCKELIPSKEVETFVLVLKEMRDNRDAYLEKARKQAKY
jgi:hypothetical protein